MAHDPLFVGIDVGTSGVRAVAIDRGGTLAGQASAAMPAPDREGGGLSQDPAQWWRAVETALGELAAAVPAKRIVALAVDGTSGTLLVTDGAGTPLAPALMYNDARSTGEAARVKQVAPPDSGGHGATSALAKLLHFQGRGDLGGARHALHQADWIAGRLTNCFGVTDENNCLKMGYDVVARRWPDWFDALGVRRDLLSEVRVPGTVLGPVDDKVADQLGLPRGVRMVAGTTDGVAAFLATGAFEIGDAVTSLGSTLVVKLLSNAPLFDATSGVYSHRLGDLWLPGGASNSGGAALLRFFTAERMVELTPRLQPDRPTGLSYYPLPASGERFPIHDPGKSSITEPRPDDDALFLQGLLEGIAEIEVTAYRHLRDLGAPALRSVRNVGGGAQNPAWTAIRARRLGVAMPEPVSLEAAYGTALLAQRGAASA
ncbi:xylulokinase [Rhodospirillaceae bacterium SYSU D60014]|uniref:FGGY-family carbohydrate kinase n=1 Tax=Virgifigura deserti TaxID=2268457 RepID=UPI000E665DBD